MMTSQLLSPGAEGGMLGARLKSWMEAQLGRAKRRKQKPVRTPPATTGPPPAPHLSSPESAYSTGYSTDGTSPGALPTLTAPLVAPPPPPAPPTTHLYHEPAKVNYTTSPTLIHRGSLLPSLALT